MKFMLALHWLSFQRLSIARRSGSPETELELLRKNLLAAAANANALGTRTEVSADSMTPLLEMLEVVRVELGKIDSSTALIVKNAAAQNQSPRPQRKKRLFPAEPAAQRIARRLVEQGVPVAEAARKTLLPESVVQNLIQSSAPKSVPAPIPLQVPMIERIQLLL